MKIGLDTNMLVYLAVCPSNFEKFISTFLNKNHIAYFADVSRDETIGILINKYHFSKEDAKSIILDFIKKGFIKISLIGDDKALLQNRVMCANMKVSKNKPELDMWKGEDILCPDSEIIATFIKHKINIVFTMDAAFSKVCSELGIETLPVPPSYIKKAEESQELNRRLVKIG